MKSVYSVFVICFAALTLSLLTHDVQASCSCGENTFLWQNLTPAAPGQTATTACTFAGDYNTVNVISGETYIISTCGDTDFDTQLALYNGSTCIVANDDFCGLQSEISYTATFTGLLEIHVFQFNCQTNSICMTLNVTWQTSGVPNDLCTGALPISCGTSVTGSNAPANNLDAPGTCNTQLLSGDGVWYSWTGDGSLATFTTCNAGTNYNTKIGVFSGSCTLLTCVDANDDDFSCPGIGTQSTVSFASVSGTNYFIYVTGFSTASGNFELSLDCSLPPISSFPACEDFEAFSTCGTTCGNLCTLQSGWQNTEPTRHWTVDIGGTSSGSTGPSTDFVPGTSSGKYLYTETSGTCSGSDVFILQSPTYDFTSITAPLLEFYYHMQGTAMGTMHLDVSTNGGSTWTTDIIPAWTDNLNAWQLQQVPMPTYAGETNFKFRIRSVSGTSFTSDMAVDYFCMKELPLNDIAVTDIISPVDNDCGTANDDLIIEVTNLGFNSQSNIPVVAVLTGMINGNPSGTLIGPLAFGQSGTINLGPLNTAAGGTLNINASAILVGDENIADNSLSTSVNIEGEPAAPSATGDSICAGDSTNVMASPDPGLSISWYDASTGGSLLGTGNSLPTGPLFATTTYYAEQSAGTIANVGPADNTFGTGANYNFTDGGLVFDVFQPTTLISAFVYATGSGNRTFELRTSGGTVLSSTTFFVPDGPSRVTLNIALPVGTGLRLQPATGSTINLYRNNSGAAYPYTLPGVMSITGAANGLSAFYYFFYDMEIGAPGCPSARTGATVYVEQLPPVADFNFTVLPSGLDVLFNNISTGDYNTYMWDFGDGNMSSAVNPFHTYAVGGNYWVTLIVTNPCGADTISYQVRLCDDLIADFEISDTLSCEPFTIQMNDLSQPMNQPPPPGLPGGNNPIVSWDWDFGDGGTSTQQNPSHTYNTGGNFIITLVVTNSIGCKDTATMPFTVPSPLVMTVDQVTHVSCNGADDGAIDITVSGGTPAYIITWSNGATTEDISVLAPNIYSVTVTDQLGCDEERQITITQPDSLLTTISSPTVQGGYNISCNGDADGFVNLTVTGGTPPYAYNWSNGAGSEDINPLGPGTYTVTVTDNNGCSAINSITLTEPPVLSVTVTGTHISCLGGSDGTATAVVTGGTPPYNYNWGGPNLTGLSAGTYAAVITDANGCFASASILLVEPAQLTVTTTKTNVTCYGGSDGALVTNVSGGTPFYAWLWSNGSTTPNISGLTAGLYAVTITDLNGCTATTARNIAQPDSFNFSAIVSDALCNGSSDGAIDLTVIGNTSPYTFNWSNGGTTEDLTGLTAGTYSATITDANSCTGTFSTTVNEPPVLTSFMIVTDPLCNGGNDGSADLSFNGGTPPYTYTWGHGPNSQDVFGLSAGSYIVTITDANSCVRIDTAEVNEPPALATTQVVTDANCHGSSDGAIDLTITGGTPGYTYMWSNGATTADISGLTAGAYTVSVTDNHNCLHTATITVGEPGPLTLTANITDAGCGGTPTGAIDLTVTGGTSPYSYSWSTGSTMEDLTGLAVGSYTVTVTDDHSCTAVQTFQVLTIDLNATITHVSCNGLSDGAIDLNPTNGTGPYTFAWSTGASSEDLNNLVAGSYSVTVTDNAGCTVSDTYNVTEPDVLAASANATNISCFGETDGSIDLVVTGGTQPYSYSWSNGSTTEDLSGLLQNSYSVTVTDANGCVTNASANIVEPGLLAVNNTGTDASCNGGADGTVTANLTGGTSPFTYIWSNGGTTATITGLSAGFYAVTVIDDNQCDAYGVYTVGQPTAVAVAWSTTDASCNGFSDGAIDITVSGGTPGYSYSWSTGTTTEDVSGLAAGSYTVTATDANGCTAEANITVGEPTLIVISKTITDVDCNGASTGAISIVVVGGVPGYNFAWSHGPITKDVGGLAAGTYDLTITDTTGCVMTGSYTVGEPPVLSSTVVKADVTCFGESTGVIDLTITGGTPPYSYMWSDSAVTEDRFGILAGTYGVTATDANGCTIADGATITQPLDLIVFMVDSSNVACNGGATGVIDIAATGGVTPYTYSWSNGAVTQDLTGVVAGLYSVVVTDGNSCTATLQIIISEPSVLAANVTGTTPVTCFGFSDGSVNISVSGGVQPYSYIWSDGSTTANNSNAAAGAHGVTVTDANNCTVSAVATIATPAALVPSVTATNVVCNGGNTGSIIVGLTGGTPPYTFAWSTGDNTQNLLNLSAGSYNGTITDANNCVALISATITEPNAITGTFIVTDVNCKGGASGAVDLSVSGGTPPYGFAWNNGVTTEDLNNVEAGTFTVTVTDASGCTFTGSATVNEPTQLASILAVTTVSECHGGNDGAIDLSVSGGTPGYTYTWSNGANTEDISGLTAGWYHVSVVDANNCLHVDSAEVTLDPGMSITSSSSNVTCNTGSDGSINITVTGGAPPYNYSWTDGATTEDRNGLTAGIYNLLVLDARNCPEVLQVTITEPTALSLSFQQTAITCAGGGDGTAEAIVSGGTPPYSYLWETGSTLSEITGLSAGRYSVDITDANGCIIIDSVNIGNAPAIVITLVRVSVRCNGGNDGGVNSTVQGGTSPYTYNWSNGATTDNISGVVAGVYDVTVTDANGCTGTTSTTVTQPTPLSAVVNAVDVTCNGFTDGEITVNATGSTPPYSYTWSTGDSTQSVFNLGLGSYGVTVTDANGCQASKSGTIGEPAAVSITGVVTHLNCYGDLSGAIDISATSGSGFTFLWSNGSNSQDLSGIAGGTYSVTAVNSSGCSGSATFTVNEPPLLTISMTGTNVSCNSGNDGSAAVTASGGTPPYSYAWGGGQTTSSISNLSAATYDVTVTDANGCNATGSTTISEPSTLSLTLNVTDISCNGLSDGSISATVSGGTATFSFVWNTGATAQTISGLTSGSYSCTITDANGCTASASGTVQMPSALSITSLTSDVTCDSNADGAIDLTVTGGTGAYSFSWSNGATTEDLSGLLAGTYMVTATDANGCTATATFQMDALIIITATSTVTGVTCNGDADGAIDLSVSGGFGTYTYAWSTGETTQDISGLAGGIYMVTIVDISGCQIVESITVNEPGVIVLFFLVTDVSTVNGNDGAIDLVVNGGTSPFTYFWSNGATTQDLNNLPAGQYTVGVTDANGCQQFGGISVGQPLTNCVSPTNLGAINIGPTSAVLTWDTAGNADHYRIRGRRIGTTGWVILVIPTSDIDFKQVFGLGTNRTFEWQIRSYCDASETIASEWSPMDSFTTVCPMVTNTWTTNITATAAVFNWDPVAPSAGYEIQGRVIGGPWVPIFVGPSTTQKQVSILNAGTTYQWRVRNYCDNPSPKSEWSILNTFTTPSAKRGDDLISGKGSEDVSIGIYPNPNEGQFRLEYNGNSSDEVQLRIFNIKGDVIVDERITSDAPINQHYNLTQHGKGLYTVQVTDGDTITHERFIVQ